ncbi:unnamed protein product [Tilletia laevis]|nr:unnamed protein product [Tilletia caries]CAD6912233.1 unnamed protein product [Tilletia laevis]
MDSSPQPDVISSEPWNVSTRPPALPLRLRGSKATAFGELVSRQLGSIHARRKSKILNYDRNKICEYNRDNVNPSHRQDDIAALFGIERLDGLAHYEGSGPLVGHQCLGGRSEYCQASCGTVSCLRGQVVRLGRRPHCAERRGEPERALGLRCLVKIGIIPPLRSAGRVQTYDLPSRIALPHIVIRELEGFKTGGRFDSVRIAARQANRWILACLQAQKRSVSTFLSKDAIEMVMRAAIAAGGAPTDVATAAEATTAALNPPVAWALHFETARQHKERMKEDPARGGEAELMTNRL